MKNVCHPPPKIVVSHNDEGFVLPKVVFIVDGEVVSLVPIFECVVVFLLGVLYFLLPVLLFFINFC